MSSGDRSAATVNIEIDAHSLKKIIDQGRLVEFISKFPAVVANSISMQLVEQIAAASANPGSLSKGISVKGNVGFEDDFGNGGPHWPRPHGGSLDVALAKGLANTAAK